jgi:hypothetical protein
MIVSQPQILSYYRKITLDSLVVDGTINPSLPSVGLIDQVINMVTSLVEPIDAVVDLIPSLVNPTLPPESETQAVDLFPAVNPILPLEDAT